MNTISIFTHMNPIGVEHPSCHESSWLIEIPVLGQLDKIPVYLTHCKTIYLGGSIVPELLINQLGDFEPSKQTHRMSSLPWVLRLHEILGAGIVAHTWRHVVFRRVTLEELGKWGWRKKQLENA